MLSQQLANGLEYLARHMVLLPEPYPGCILFFTVAAENKVASVFHVRATTLEAAWREGATRVRQWAWARKRDEVDLRIDWAQDITPLEADSPLPDCCAWTQAPLRCLALADASLERAQLLHPLLPDPPRSEAAAGTPGDADTLRRPLHPPCLLLHLRGIYISGEQPPLAVPRTDPPQQRLWPHLVPVHAAVQQLLAQQGKEGSWPGCEDLCDHLGVTYALLQAQRHAGSAALAQAIALAMDHVEQRLQPLPGDCLPGALAMLVLARHLRNSFVLGPGADSQARSRIPALMDPLAESLLSTAAASASATEAAAAAGADASRSGQPLLSWAELAMHAYASSRPPTSDSPTLRAARSALPETAVLPAAFLQAALPPLLHMPGSPDDRQGEQVDDPRARWIAIALVESLQLDAGLEPQPTDLLRQWQISLQRHLQAMAQRAIWPEQALYLPPARRRHAAFADASLRQVLQSPREIAWLLASSLAGLELLDALALALRSAASHAVAEPEPEQEPEGEPEGEGEGEGEAEPARAGNGLYADNGPATTSLPGARDGEAAGRPSFPSAAGSPYPSMSWEGPALAELMNGRWLHAQSAPGTAPSPCCAGLDASRLHHQPGAAVLVRRAGMALGVQAAALPTLRASALISSSPQGLLHHGVPVLHVPDMQEGLRSLAQAARRRIRSPVIAVSGCVGKTSTLGMLRQCLQDGGDARGDALLSQGTALQMINWSEAAPCALLELPLQALRGDLPLIDPDILVITNLSINDIPISGDAEQSGQAGLSTSHKYEALQEVVEAMQHMHKGSALVIEQGIGENPCIIENAQRMGMRLITFGPHSNAQIREMGFHNGNLQISIDNRRLGICLQSDGHHMALNAQAALAAVHALGYAPAQVQASLAHWRPLIGAGQPQLLPSGICLLDHSLSNHLLSMHAAFSQLQEHAPHVSRRLIVLAGIQPGQVSMDTAQLALEPLVRAAQARRVLLYGEPLRQLAAALADLLHVNWYDDLNQLICSLLRTTHKGDTVLLAGRATTNLALAADAIRDSFSGHGAPPLASSAVIRFDPHQNQMNMHY
ncbi:Mur ligase [Delftia sp. HK171]|uniref:Mur ligase n=1 Tax=Delftia sp. HK171 TaxID=1920191 RepID=UPI0011547771|nr:Mur ligase [Delftia sp. HK171]TQL83141.1 UDP-N-acetylmuramyl pentapeptide synthase [Delftia sp. HK171]